MTAEIAIINRQAIALAADSAVTIGRERVWKYSNKLFSLGPSNDIAIMIYGSGQFGGYPWDTIIKTFRSENGTRQFQTIAECGESFLTFLRDVRFRPDQLNRNIHLALVLDQLNKMKEEIPAYSKKAEFRKSLSELCDDYKARYEAFPEIEPRQSYRDFCVSHDKSILTELAAGVFKEVITAPIAEKISRAMYEYASRCIESNYATGIVVAGYGREQFFPVVLEYKVDGRDGDFVRNWLHAEQNLNLDDARKTIVMPFAQSDIFYLFMEGISPEYIVFLNVMLKKLLDNKSDILVREYVSDPDERVVETERQRRANETIMENFQREFGEFRAEMIVQPIVRVVRALPKEEMADMALALVELTSLRRKVDSPLESVGGPVDVAVISKGDGLIWIKRKHYFDIDKNQEFLDRKTMMRSRLDGQGS